MSTHQPIAKITVSFIVPIYNVENYLPECIESLLKQSVSKEIILIDDGSTDNSLEIALDYAKRYPFIFVLHSQNKGVSAARNQGIRLAQGEYIYFIDSDDYLVGDYLPQAISLAKMYSADLVRLQAEMVYANQVLFPIQTLTKSLKENNAYIHKAGDAFHLAVESGWKPGFCWTMIRKAFMENHKLYFYEGLLAEDQLFCIQLFTSDLNATLIELPFTVYQYRLREGSIAMTLNQHYLESHYRIIQEIHHYIQSKGLSEDNKFRCSIGAILAVLKRTAESVFERLPENIQKQVNYDMKPIFEQYNL